ncbi:hypothetical protein RJ639_015633 [Escallonia herrerae]|uniref:glycerophosphodiester phosphodiesterase n=1 Tax=Escallonia herrerae TaxID=1293975 RepID=A0AA88VHS3_9ASTE|nr:hypothetical protein RJ639_015633 [Escallonia herrerae]
MGRPSFFSVREESSNGLFGKWAQTRLRPLAPPPEKEYLALRQETTGNAPLVIARGGFSGQFPDSSDFSNSMALNISIDNLIVWCDVQLTSDGAGICLPDLRLDNSTNVGVVFKNKQKKYLVNGVPMEGYELANVTLIQGVLSRINRFDECQLQVLTVEDVSQKYQPPGLWLNVQVLHQSSQRDSLSWMEGSILLKSLAEFVPFLLEPTFFWCKQFCTMMHSSASTI